MNDAAEQTSDEQTSDEQTSDEQTSDEQTSDEQESRDDIWSERAAALVLFIKSVKPPVKRQTLSTFAQRKGWEQKTLEDCLGYCVEKKLLARFTPSSGGTAWKIPLTPVHEEEGEEGDSVAPAELRVSTACLCASTAPSTNYGCPQHGRARRAAEENTTMAKDWIGAAEAAALIDSTTGAILQAASKGKIESKTDDDYHGKGKKPRLLKRSSVIAYRDTKRKSVAADLLDKPKKKAPPESKSAPEPKAIAAKTVRAPKPAAVTSDLADDVRALVRNVERGWMSAEDVIGKLRALVA